MDEGRGIMNDVQGRRIANLGISPATRITGRVIFGLVLVVLGCLWTLDSLDLIESEPILDWWPLALVVFGLSRLTGIGGRRHTVMGAVFTFAGAWMLLHEFDFVSVRLSEIWPMVLVLIGGFMVWNSLRRTAPAGPADAPGAVGTDDPSATLSTLAFWSGNQHKIVSQAFRGGEATAVMGGADIDFRPAKLAGGRTVLDVFVWWGGIDLFVPEDWKVVNEAFVMMGAIEDKSKAPPVEATQTLVLRGLVVMGGVEIKN